MYENKGGWVALPGQLSPPSSTIGFRLRGSRGAPLEAGRGLFWNVGAALTQVDWHAAVGPMWHTYDSEDQNLALALNGLWGRATE